MAPDLSGVTAAILAGGLGTRLRPLVTDRPKVLAEIQGRPFLAYLLDQLTAAGVRHVVLCTGYLGEQLRDLFGYTYGSLHLAYSQEPEPLGTAGALRLALPLFKSDAVLVMNGDSFCETDLGALWTWHCARNAEATLLITQIADTKPYGRVHVASDGRMLRFCEKSSEDSPGWINGGIYLLEHALLLTIPSRGVVSLERDMFPLWINRRFYGYRSKARFLDIGIPETYAAAKQLFALKTLF